jgi:hypothetical protein
MFKKHYVEGKRYILYNAKVMNTNERYKVIENERRSPELTGTMLAARFRTVNRRIDRKTFMISNICLRFSVISVIG